MSTEAEGEGMGEQRDALPSSDLLLAFHTWFQGFHGYASIVVCLFGIFTNFFNITILTRKDMRTPTNLLLLWLAVSDILTMVPYIPFAANFYCPPASPATHPERFSYGWILYMLMMINFVATTHTISIWIGVALAAVRFVQMRSTSRGPVAKERRIRNVKNAGRQTGRQAERQAGRQADRRAGRQTDRQTPGATAVWQLKEACVRVQSMAEKNDSKKCTL